MSGQFQASYFTFTIYPCCRHPVEVDAKMNGHCEWVLNGSVVHKEEANLIMHFYIH